MFILLLPQSQKLIYNPVLPERVHALERERGGGVDDAKCKTHFGDEEAPGGKYL